MPNPSDIPQDSFDILRVLVERATELGILVADGAAPEELDSAQQTVEMLQQELTRRISW